MPLNTLAAPIRARSAPSLHQRFLAWAGVSGAVVIAILGTAANVFLSRDINRQGDARITDAAGRGLLVIDGALADRARLAKVLGRAPSVTAAAREGTARSRALGIVGGAIPALEVRFAEDRSLSVAPDAREFLRAILTETEAAEIQVTDANGYNAITTQRTSDFVQGDEEWWQAAWKDGISPATAAFDSSARQTTLSIAAAVQDGSEKVGVIKLAFSAAPLVASLASAGAGVRLDVLDSTGTVLLSSDSTAVGRQLQGVLDVGGSGVSAAMLDNTSSRAATELVNSGRWRVVSHLPSSAIDAPFRTMRIALVGGVATLIVILLLLLLAMNRFLKRRITQPAMALAEAAEAVAAGDFSLDLEKSVVDDEIGRLNRAVGAMILELRRLATEIATSARETNAMSSEITAGSEEMAATAGEIASTASDLSHQATTMAETIASLAGSAQALKRLAVELDEGARLGITRNTALRSLAVENRAGLVASAESLGSLAFEVNSSNAAIVELGSASEEIRSFVTLVRSLARQSKLLALNAAMEAARAGEHGHGFAVVAAEVRRLATMSTDAAEHTGKVMKGVLKGIQSSRDSADRAVSTADEVRRATASASESFAHIEDAVAESEAWTETIASASTATGGLVAEITARLEVLAGGTDSFAAAMQQVAASSQEQSASTEEIAAAANSLGSASERLSKLVAGLKAKR